MAAQSGTFVRTLDRNLSDLTLTLVALI